MAKMILEFGQHTCFRNMIRSILAVRDGIKRQNNLCHNLFWQVKKKLGRYSLLFPEENYKYSIRFQLFSSFKSN